MLAQREIRESDDREVSGDTSVQPAAEDHVVVPKKDRSQVFAEQIRTHFDLSYQQARFVAAWNGNAARAAREAGYSHPKRDGHRLLKQDKVRRAIYERELIDARESVASRVEIQEFWTSVIRDNERPMKERISASVNLAKSHGMFLDTEGKSQQGGNQNIAIQINVPWEGGVAKPEIVDKGTEDKDIDDGSSG